MTGTEPVDERPFDPEDAMPPTTWAAARRQLAESQFCWLATARPDGRPHLMPVLAVWLDDTSHFCTGPSSRKGRNLARDPHCVMAVGGEGLHLVVEGVAARVRDATRLQRVAAVYGSKYGWRVTVGDSALHGDGAPTAGPPPYEVYEVIPTNAFGLGTDDSLGATRWRF